MTGQEGPSCLLLAYCARPLAARNAATYQHSTPHTDTRANQSHLGPLSSLDPKAPGRFLLRQQASRPPAPQSAPPFPCNRNRPVPGRPADSR